MSKPVRSTPAAPRPSSTSPITPAAVARIQGAVAKQKGGAVPSGSYVGRIQRVVAKRTK